MIFNVTGGGGTALNFRVLAYASKEELLAAKPSENAIGIITTAPITSWIFSATEPSPAAAGMVWISTGTSSTVGFNALKKNAIQVYPLSAKQYVDGAWVDVTAMSYQGGKWVDWTVYLYNQGVLTGSLVAVAKGISENKNTRQQPTVTYNDDNITITLGGTYHDGGVVYFSDKYDLSVPKTLYADFSVETTYGASLSKLYIWSALGTYINSNAVAVLSSTGELDISALSGEYFIGFGIYGQNSKIKLKQLQLT